VPWFALL
jgi:hypothetical protein